MTIRCSSHAGSWYSDDGDCYRLLIFVASVLQGQFNKWLEAADVTFKPARAIISPHAGYRYSGPCAAYAFKQIDPTITKHVFILGPSHHADLGTHCGLSPALSCQTPLYNIPVDTKIIKELEKTGEFIQLSLNDDEAEHSIEMQLPFLAHVMQGYEFSIVPIMVGALSTEREAVYGHLLAPYLMDRKNLFIISSDFCHWGSRFRYQLYDESDGEIWQSIQELDRKAMKSIETLTPTDFTNYLRSYKNTICGRRGISILLQSVQYLKSKIQPIANCEMRFLHYAQSSQCRSMRDSSVSYAAASLMIN